MGKKKIQIGEYEVLANYSLLVPKDATVSIPVCIDTISLTLEIKFDNESTEKSVSFTVTDSVVTLIFHKWDSALGTAIREVEPLITLGTGQPLFFMASNYLIGDVNNFTLYLLQRERGAHVEK